MTNPILHKILEENPNVSFHKIDGFDSAIIGFQNYTYKLIYSKSLIMTMLLDAGLNRKEAIQQYRYNIEPMDIGDKTPILVEDDFQL